MSRTMVEQHAGNINLLSMDAPVIAERLMTKYAPGLIDKLVEQPRWHFSGRLRGSPATRLMSWSVWEQLLWALETIGTIEVRSEDHALRVRISTSGWLREVQRRAAARSGDPVPV